MMNDSNRNVYNLTDRVSGIETEIDDLTSEVTILKTQLGYVRRKNDIDQCTPVIPVILISTLTTFILCYLLFSVF